MQSQHYYLANLNQTQVIFQKFLPKFSLYMSDLFPMRFEIGETSTYKNSLMSLLSLVIFGQFKRAAGRQVLFTVPFVIISSLTTSLAVSVKILLKVFSVCAIL
ncbi:hypothetical protein, partial [Streptococcus suis]|uniref:hypothetical protein n=2 Tax=Streptococcus suis TaxID=1307 RepID=UPI0005CF814B